jgi:hypothetical protein
MEADVTTTPTFRLLGTKTVFNVSGATGWAATSTPWDVDPDGRRFLVPELSGDSLPFTLILNWNAGLKP